MTVAVVGSYNLNEINLAAAELTTLMIPVLSQLDLALTGSFGLGALEADIAGELDASASAELSFGFQIANPIEALKQALEAAIEIQADIAATLALGLPAISTEVSVELSASASASVALAAKVGGIQALISAALAAKIPCVNFVRDTLLNLNVGPVVLLSFGTPFDTLSSAGAGIHSLCQAGFLGIDPSDQVYGVVLLTPAPLAWASMQVILKTS